jgi:aryl-alcohol dehydrogenase-like predicted oxidoreductase
MKYRKFGKLGWNISEIGFGGWAIGGDMWGWPSTR